MGKREREREGGGGGGSKRNVNKKNYNGQKHTNRVCYYANCATYTIQHNAQSAKKIMNFVCLLRTKIMIDLGMWGAWREVCKNSGRGPPVDEVWKVSPVLRRSRSIDTSTKHKSYFVDDESSSHSTLTYWSGYIHTGQASI